MTSTNRWMLAAILSTLLLTLTGAALAADTQPADIDWTRAKQLYQKNQSGQALTPEEKDYLDKALKARAAGQGPAAPANPASPAGNDADLAKARQLMQKAAKGEALTPDEKAFVDRVRSQRPSGGEAATPKPPITPEQQHINDLLQKQNLGQPLTDAEKAELQKARAQWMATSQKSAPQRITTTQPTGLIPLDQMTANEKYKGENGGLYGDGANVPPPALQKAVDAALTQVKPLNDKGQADPNGKIVMISIGMSNTTMEFSRFKELADADAARNPKLTIVDCAQGGIDALRWSNETDAAWKTALKRIETAGVSPQQVQVVWMKHALIGVGKYGEYPKHADELIADINKCLDIARKHFPNLRLVYCSSRIYAGFASGPLNPEPYAYESGLAVRSLILGQLKGEIKAPVLLWGPYLWADGPTPRKSDGLFYTRDDLAEDGTHPSRGPGRDKVAALMLTFFKTNANAKAWFTAGSGK